MERMAVALVLFVLFGFFVIGGFLTIWFAIFRGFGRVSAQSRWNARQSVVSLTARVIARRSVVNEAGEDYAASTSYYATFETSDGERHELPVSGVEYDLLAEGDAGILSLQGTAYRGFKRERVALPR